ncbi:MAG: hypothetical protein SFY96_13240 [Planctomycetota bacterium]|nr:hypothetical protein [Planctomycetota bacterium]
MSHSEPEADARRAGAPLERHLHAARSLAIATLLLLAARQGADAYELIDEAKIAKLAISADVLGGEVCAACVPTLAWAACSYEAFESLTAHCAVAVAALAARDASITDATFAAVCLHAHELSERWRRPRHGLWRKYPLDAHDHHAWLYPLQRLLTRSLRGDAGRRGSEARTAAAMLAERLLGVDADNK